MRGGLSDLLKVLLQFILLLSSLSGFTQPTSQPDLQNTFGPGTSKSTNVTTDHGYTETVIEYKDADGYVRQRKVERKYPNGSSESTDSTFSPGGRVVEYWIHKKNTDGKVIFIETKKFTRGKLDKGFTSSVTYNADGSVTEVIRDFKTGTSETINTTAEEELEYEEERRHRRRMIELRTNPGTNCVPKADVYGGYSLLNADYGTTREIYLLGFNAGILYNLTGRLGVVLDASIHMKKENDFKDRQTYVGIGVQYDLKPKDCDPAIIPFVNTLAGLRFESSYYNGDKTHSETDFAAMLGGGFHYNPTKKYDLSLGLNYNPVFGTSLQHNFRASFIVKYHIGNQ